MGRRSSRARKNSTSGEEAKQAKYLTLAASTITNKQSNLLSSWRDLLTGKILLGIVCLHLFPYLLNYMLTTHLTAAANQAKSDAFLQWFDDAGGLHPNVSLAQFPGMGRGVVATSDIPYTAMLISVPLSITLCRDTILEHAATNISAEAQEALAKVDSDTDLLSLFLAFEKAKGLRSQWAPYINVLPSTMVSATTWFSQEELNWLQDDALSSAARTRRDKVKQSFVSLSSTVDVLANQLGRALPGGEPGGSTSGALDLKAFEWAVSLVDSRALTMQGRKFMVPFADMFNYSPDGIDRAMNQGMHWLDYHTIDSDVNHFVVAADRTTPIHSQVFEDYGDNSNQLYLEYHGFVPLNNPFDCLPVHAPRPHEGKGVSASLGKARVALLQALRLPATILNGCVGVNNKANGDGGNADMSSSRSLTGFENLLSYFTILAMDETMLTDCVDTLAAQQQGATARLLSTCLDDHKDDSSTNNSEQSGQVQVAMTRKALKSIKTVIDKSVQQNNKQKAHKDSEDAPADNDNIQVALQYRKARDVLTQRILEQINIRYIATTQEEKEISSISSLGTAMDSKEGKQIPVSTTAASDIDVNLIESPEESHRVNENNIATTTKTTKAVKSSKKKNDMPVGDGESNDENSILAQKVVAFNEWMNNNSSDTNSNGSIGPFPVSLIEAAVIPKFRIGAIATSNIAAEQVYLSVPPHAVMDVETSRRSKVSGVLEKIVAKFGGRRDDFHHLLLTLLWERFVEGEGNEVNGGLSVSPSQWWPYLALLPTPQEMDAPAFWTLEQLEELKGTQVYNDVVAWKMQVRDKYKAVKTHVLDKFDAFNGDNAAAFSENNYLWAHAILDSRAIWWNGQRHLVPMLDLVNCGPGPNKQRVHGTVADKEDNAVTKADRAFNKGSQVFEDYGQPNSIYLTYHGFTLGDENQHHCVQVQQAYIQSSTNNQQNQQPVCVPTSSLRDGNKSDVDRQVWEQLTRLGYVNRQQQMQALKIAAKMQLDSYPTSVETDEAILLERDEVDGDHRVHTAILYRLQEKKLLTAIINNEDAPAATSS